MRTQALVEDFFQALVAGILDGSIYGLMCVGLGLIFGIMRVINFAQGEFLMLGMYFTLYIVTGLGLAVLLGPYVGPFVGVALAGLALFVGGYLLHRYLVSRGFPAELSVCEKSPVSCRGVGTVLVKVVPIRCRKPS